VSEEADKALQEFAEKEPDEPPLQAHEAARLCRWFLAGFAAGRASRTPLVWSTEPPKVPGWYFTRGVDVRGNPLTRPMRFDYPAHWFAGVEFWAGPIPEPEEPR
jgi:hypothetical protein